LSAAPSEAAPSRTARVRVFMVFKCGRPRRG
jgi:hypothetical protein